MFPQLVAIVEQATDIGADLHVVFPQRLAVQHGVIREHLVHLQRGHAHALRHLLDQLLGDVAHFILRVEQHRNHGRALAPLGIALEKLRKSGFELWRKGHQRSVSPSTKSMLPMEAITLAIMIPSTILGTACKLPKLGVRMCTR